MPTPSSTTTPKKSPQQRAKAARLHSVLRTADDLGAAVSRYATNEMLAEGLKLECDAEIKAITERYMAKLETVQAAMAEDFEAIEDYARRHRAEIFKGDSKTITVHGHELSFRTSSPSVDTAKGTTQKAVLLSLLEHEDEAWADKYVRWKESLNKEAILAEYNPELKAWKPGGERLAELGVVIDQTERFHLKTSRTLSTAQTTRGEAETLNPAAA